MVLAACPPLLTAQAPLLAVEQQLVRAFSKAGICLPVWLCVPVASLTLQVPAMYWFWGAYFAAVEPRSSPLAPAPSAAAAATLSAFGAVDSSSVHQHEL